MEKEKELIKVVAIALNMDETKVAELIESDEKWNETLINRRKEIVAAQKKKEENLWNDSAKERDAKLYTKIETDIKKKHGIESDKPLMELIDEVITTKIPEPKKGQITEEDIKKHPLYLSKEKREQELEKMVEQVKAETETNVRQEYTKKEQVAKLKKLAENIAKNANPLLPADAQKAQTQLERLYLNDFENIPFEFMGENEVILLDEKGKRLEDELGHLVKFEDFAMSKLRANFEIPVATDRTSTTSKDKQQAQPDNTGKLYEGGIPKNDTEYLALINKLSSEKKPSAVLVQVKADYEASKNGK